METGLTPLESGKLMKPRVKRVDFSEVGRFSDTSMMKMIPMAAKQTAVMVGTYEARQRNHIPIEYSSAHCLSAEARIEATIKVKNQIEGNTVLFMDHRIDWYKGDHVMISNEVDVSYKSPGHDNTALASNIAFVCDINPTTTNVINDALK